MSNNIIDFKIKKKLYDRDGCQHDRIEVDDSLYEIKCLDCGEKLNPVWYLCQIAFKQNKLKKMYDEYNKLARMINNTKVKLKTINKCKCEHCGKMTKVIKSI